MKYSKENYPSLIQIQNHKNSNLIGYLPGKIEEVKCPKLIINENIIIVNFRGYYWSDMRLLGSNDGLVSYFKNSHLLGSPINIVNSIIEGAGENKINFSIEEVNLIYSWYRDTLDFHNIDF